MEKNGIKEGFYFSFSMKVLEVSLEIKIYKMKEGPD